MTPPAPYRQLRTRELCHTTVYLYVPRSPVRLVRTYGSKLASRPSSFVLAAPGKEVYRYRYLPGKSKVLKVLTYLLTEADFAAALFRSISSIPVF